MKHFLLIYDYAPDFMEKRGPLRPAHLALANEYVARGELVLGGAAPGGQPPFGLLLFKAAAPETAEAFANADPYVSGGVVSAWRVCEWITVVGEGALTKV
ncbi:MAG: YciI-like protein [Hyphomonadaceae bacterium]